MAAPKPFARQLHRIDRARTLRDLARDAWRSTASDDLDESERTLTEYQRRRDAYIVELESLACSVRISLMQDDDLERALDIATSDARRQRNA